MLPEPAYNSLLDNIGQTFSAARAQAYAAVNQQLLEAYWNIGRYIVEYEQQGQGKAVYGKQLIQQLSKDLSVRLGKGFSKTQLYQMRQFYDLYPIFQSVTGKFPCRAWCFHQAQPNEKSSASTHSAVRLVKTPSAA